MLDLNFRPPHDLGDVSAAGSDGQGQRRLRFRGLACRLPKIFYTFEGIGSTYMSIFN
jgi:hypothetical protein